MNIEAILNYMENVPGWFTREEGKLIYQMATDAVMRSEYGNVVEVGSYCGRSTTALGFAVKNAQRGKVYAIDPCEGNLSGVSSAWSGTSQLSIFRHNLTVLSLDGAVTLIQKKSTEVPWASPIAFLFIDGLHDAQNVSADLAHFFPHVEKGGLVAFHDYGNPDYPDVKRIVDGLINEGKLTQVASAFHLIVTRKG